MLLPFQLWISARRLLTLIWVFSLALEKYDFVLGKRVLLQLRVEPFIGTTYTRRKKHCYN